MAVKLLVKLHLKFLSLKGCCTGSFESTLVKMTHCWKSHAEAQLLTCFDFICSTLKAILSSSKGQPPETKVTLANNLTVVAKRQVNSNVIGASFPGVPIKNLDEPVKVTFQHFKVNA